jgi:hypothetical protein
MSHSMSQGAKMFRPLRTYIRGSVPRPHFEYPIPGPHHAIKAS